MLSSYLVKYNFFNFSVVFDKHHLIVFMIFLKPIFQRFLIVMAVIVVCWSIMVFINSGPYTVVNKSFKTTVERIVDFAIGIALPEENSALMPRSFRDLVFIFDIGNFFIKLLVTNFSLVIIFYFYRKFSEKRAAAEELHNMPEEERQKMAEEGAHENPK